MSIFSDATRLISKALNLTTESLSSIESGLHTVNHYVAENSYSQDQQITANAQLSLSEHHNELASKLAADSDLKTQYDSVVANWRKTPEPA